jgi:hypothetical protein
MVGCLGGFVDGRGRDLVGDAVSEAHQGVKSRDKSIIEPSEGEFYPCRSTCYRIDKLLDIRCAPCRRELWFWSVIR